MTKEYCKKIIVFKNKMFLKKGIIKGELYQNNMRKKKYIYIYIQREWQ